ncbi:glycosyltransferase [Bacteroides sp.]|uniref:glycosyltransferase n=1 Tax=Bacteroides sp. TaxID=29523 RepID=UPI0026209B79|nr:glycosyltransferase [Bacteroides sp.]MDD3037277.1 glycosyltransferase [Bacteroides sp.]
MKIVHINYSDRMGGAAIAAYRLNEAMNLAGMSSTLLVADKTDFGNQYVVTPEQRLIKMKTLFKRYWTDWSVNRIKAFGAWSYANTGFQLAKEKVVQEADVIYLHWTNFGLLSVQGIQELLNTGKPIYWFMHDMWPFTGGCHYAFDCERYKTHCGACPMFYAKMGSRCEYDLSYKQFERKKRKWSSYSNLTILTPSEWLGHCVEESRLFGDKKIQLSRNVIDTNRYRSVPQSIARNLLGLPENKKLVLFGADAINSPYKGWSYLKEAIHNMSDTIEYVVFGGCDSNAVEMETKASLHFMGRLHDDYSLMLLYNAADVLVAPSLADNYPNVILEAMACGLPVVGFNTGGIPELVEHQVTGYLANKEDSSDLCTGINWILFTADISKLKANARLKIETESSYNSISENHKDIYELFTRV